MTPEELVAKVDEAMLSIRHDWGLPDVDDAKPFGEAAKQKAVRIAIDDCYMEMRKGQALRDALVQWRDRLVDMGDRTDGSPGPLWSAAILTDRKEIIECLNELLV